MHDIRTPQSAAADERQTLNQWDITAIYIIKYKLKTRAKLPFWSTKKDMSWDITTYAEWTASTVCTLYLITLGSPVFVWNKGWLYILTVFVKALELHWQYDSQINCLLRNYFSPLVLKYYFVLGDVHKHTCITTVCRYSFRILMQFHPDFTCATKLFILMDGYLMDKSSA